MKKPSYLDFEKESYPWKPGVDYRQHPNLYRVGKGEQGVLICEPYKSEIGPYWKFRTPDIAQSSSQKILEVFEHYLEQKDFVGADLARKYLQMGFTRSRRYANYAGGRKYDKSKEYTPLEKGTGDLLKAESASIFYRAWQSAESHPLYSKWKQQWKERYG